MSTRPRDPNAEVSTRAAVRTYAPRLKSRRVGGTSSDMDALVDAKIAAAEARTDTKFAAVLAKLDSLTVEVRASRSSIWTAAFAIMALIVALVGLLATVGPSSFSVGAQMRDIARDEAQLAEQRRSPPTTAAPIAPASPLSR